MRLVGVAMVRNEADIVEAFVRHNLGFLDSLSIVDNGSVDGTSEILANLQAEGLPLKVSRDADPAYRQSDTMTALARDVLAASGADFVFALDADEFLKTESRLALERALADVPPDTHAAMHWLTYVPDAFGDTEGFGPGHLWWRLKTERNPSRKVIVGRILLERPDHVLAMGSHVVLVRDGSKIQPHALMRQDAIALAHCPVRSRAQLEGKIVVGYLAHVAARAKGAHHWHALYAELRDGATFTEDRLREIACNYGLLREIWLPSTEIELIEDPVPLNVELRYLSEARVDALRLLMQYTESLIASMAPSSGR
jgi:hypothetical protein